MSGYTSVDTLGTAVRYVDREFGYGYGLRVISSGFVNALFELHASDGSRRLFLADRYGNVECAPLEVPDASGDYFSWLADAIDALAVRRGDTVSA